MYPVLHVGTCSYLHTYRLVQSTVCRIFVSLASVRSTVGYSRREPAGEATYLGTVMYIV